MANKDKKVVVIGAGVAGLSAGIYALKLGYRAELIEKNPLPGGECTGWDRGGYHIDNCIHWLMGTTPGTDLYDLYRETRLVDGEDGVLASGVMYESRLGNERLTLYGDLERTKREWLALSPPDAAEIEALFENVKLGQAAVIPAGVPTEQLGAIAGVSLLLKSAKMFSLFKRYAGMSTQDLMGRFKHPLIRRCLSDFCPRESQASSFPVAYGNFASGDGGVPVGGARAAALRMKARFEELGGVYRGASPAARIEVSDGRATAVVLESGERIEADYMIPACDADFAFSRLLDRSYMPDKMREYFDHPETYPIYGMFQAAWAVDDPRDLLGHEVNLDAPELRVEPWLNDRVTLKTYAYEPSFAPAGKQVIQVLWGMDQSSWPYWKALGADKEAYKAKKAKLAALVQAKIEATWPEYAGKLSLLDAWTPCTYQRWCNAHNGYNQACVIPKGAKMRTAYPSPFLRGLRNVVLAGQWVTPPGGVSGSCITGKFAAYRVDYLEHKAWRIARKVFWQNLVPTAVVLALIWLL